MSNLVVREDERTGFRESFGYDDLNRLSYSQVTGSDAKGSYQHQVDIDYDAFGNITHKSDVGDYDYDPQHHQRLLRAGDSGDYEYDANGNIVSGDGKAYQWSSFNKPIQLQAGNQTISFDYDVNRQRYRKLEDKAGVITETHYLGKSYERMSANYNVEHKHYIYAAGSLVAIHTQQTSGSVSVDTTRYVHKDHLGSTDALSNEQGEIIERMSYDSWG